MVAQNFNFAANFSQISGFLAQFYTFGSKLPTNFSGWLYKFYTEKFICPNMSIQVLNQNQCRTTTLTNQTAVVIKRKGANRATKLN